MIADTKTAGNDGPVEGGAVAASAAVEAPPVVGVPIPGAPGWLAHPAAEMYPLMTGADFDELVEDIRKYGQKEAVTMIGELVLDGRNRIRGCVVNGIEPEKKQWVRNSSPEDFVVSMNEKRRHLTEGQRIMRAARMATMKRGDAAAQKADRPIGPSTLSVDEAARVNKVKPRSVKRGKIVVREGTPEEIAAVERGEVSVSKAAKRIKARKAAAGQIKRKSSSRAKKARPVEPIGRDVLDMFMADGRSLSVAEYDALAELDRKHHFEVVIVMRDGKVPTVLDAIKKVQLHNRIVPASAIRMETASDTSPENGMQPSPAAVDVAQAEPKPSQPPLTVASSLAAVSGVGRVLLDRARGPAPEAAAIAVAPHEPAAELIGPAEARASLNEDVRAAVAAGNGLSALCTAWLGAPLINRITFLGGLGLTQAAAELLAERCISIGGERVLAITGVAQEKKPVTIDGVARAEPESGSAS